MPLVFPSSVMFFVFMIGDGRKVVAGGSFFGVLPLEFLPDWFPSLVLVLRDGRCFCGFALLDRMRVSTLNRFNFDFLA